MIGKFDIIVIGSGAAGTAAALTAAEGGARVLLLEKNKFPGGISNYPAEIFAVDSKIQHQLNIPFTKDEAFNLYMESTHWQADARLVRAFIEKTASTIDWLQGFGIPFNIVPHFVYPENRLVAHAVMLPGGFTAMLKILRSEAKKRKVEIQLATPVRKLLKKGNKIVGVIADHPEGKALAITSKAVIIASGGYPNNEDMMKQYGGFNLGKDLLLLTPVKNYGEGIKMAWEAGAVPDGMGPALRYGIPSQSGHPSRWDLFILTHQPYLWVNQKGVRFFNEEITGSGGYTANALSRQKNKVAYLIFDRKTKQFLEAENGDNPSFGHAATKFNVDAVIDTCLEKGDRNIYIADSLEELARKIGIDAAVLKTTVREYNRCCEKGHDDLFAKNPRYLQPVKKPKFYAFKIIPIAYGTVGGIKINEKAEVINAADEAIPGLYAAGDCANGAISYNFWLAFTLRGNPSSFAYNTGRIAAENALKLINK